jgi:hypothetical protein
MTNNTFNRYRKGARAALLVDVPFSLGANFSLTEIAKIKEGADPAEIRRARKQRTAERATSKKATVLPLPNDDADAAEFLDDIGVRLAQFLFQIKAKMGPSGYKKLVGILRKLCRPE